MPVPPHAGEDPSALIGLPLFKLIEMLEAAGVEVVYPALETAWQVSVKRRIESRTD